MEVNGDIELTNLETKRKNTFSNLNQQKKKHSADGLLEKFKFHSLKFYDLKPHAIVSLAYNTCTQFLAVSREDGNIELWNTKDTIFLYHTIIGHKSRQIEKVLWCGENRLLSVGLDGFILEYDLHTYQVKTKVSVTGGPIWSCALSPNERILAVGTEGGYINLFDVGEGQILYRNIIHKQTGRILCLAWKHDNEHLFSGSEKHICITSIKTEKKIQFLVAEEKKNVIVWCGAFLKDDVVVTGDSSGKLRFWNSRFGTLISAISMQKMDILAMAVREDCEKIWISGIDQKIQTVVKIVGERGQKKWSPMGLWWPHKHDVRALAVYGKDNVFSGGVDTFLISSSAAQNLRYSFQPPRGYLSSCADSPCVLLGYPGHVELWRLGEPTQASQDSEQPEHNLKIQQKPAKIVEIRLTGDERLECCAGSPNARFISVSAGGRFRIYEFLTEDDFPNVFPSGGYVKKISVPKDLPRCTQMVWVNHCTVVAATLTDQLLVLQVDDESRAVISEVLKLSSPGAVARSLYSRDSMLTSVDSENRVCLFEFDVEGKAVRNDAAEMPKNASFVSAVAVDSQTLIVMYANMKCCEFDVKSKNLTQWHKSVLEKFSVRMLKKTRNAVVGISMSIPHRVLFYTANYIFVFDRRIKKKQLIVQKFESLNSLIEDNDILYMSHLGQLNLMVVESVREKILNSLPPAFVLPKFGTK